MRGGRTVVVTGASGFVGGALLRMLAAGAAHKVRGCYRSAPRDADPATASFVVGELGAATDWGAALEGADTVVHTAALAHVLRAAGDEAYRRVNVDGTAHLARRAAAAGVRRLVFLSSIKVNGELAPPERPFRASDPPAPQDAYGRSKRDAEQALARVAGETGLEVVVLRPPLVYGPGAKGNLARIMRLIESGVPLPLGAVRNRRSMIALGNLCGAIIACLDAPRAAGRTYLIAERDALSTAELARRLARAMQRRARLVPVPEALLRLGGIVTGRTAEIQRLVGSLCVDAGPISDETGWQPSAATAEADLRAMAEVWLAGRRLSR